MVGKFVLGNLVLTVTIVTTITTQVSAENTCNLLIKNGIYNKAKVASSASSQRSFQEAVLETYEQVKSGTAKIDSQGKYAVKVFEGDVHYSKDELETLSKLFSKNSSSYSADASSLNSITETIDAKALDTLKVCILAQSQGLLSDSTFSPDMKNVRVQVRNTLNTDVVAAFPKITEKASTDNLKCEPSALLQKGSIIGHDWSSANCSRRFLSPSQPTGSGIKLAEAAALVIHSSAGDVSVDLAPLIYQAEEVKGPGGSTEALARSVPFPFFTTSNSLSYYKFTSPLNAKARFLTEGAGVGQGLVKPRLRRLGQNEIPLDASHNDKGAPFQAMSLYQLSEGAEYVLWLETYCCGVIGQYPFRLQITLEK